MEEGTETNSENSKSEHSNHDDYDDDDDDSVVVKIIKPPPYKGFATWNPHSLTSEELEARVRDGRLNAVDNFNLTPLCRAIYQGDRDLVMRVLSCADLDVNATNEDGNTQLAFTAEHFPAYLDLLLNHSEIDVNLPDCFGYPPIYSIITYAPSQLPVILSHPMLNLGIKLPHGDSLLAVAVRNHRSECILPLIAAGVSTKGVVEFATCNKSEMVPLLHDAGVEFSSQDYMNCMIICINHLLRSSTFDANVRFGESSDTFLMMYIKLKTVLGLKSTVEEVLSHCSDVNASNNNGETAYTCAAVNLPSALPALVMHGADVNQILTSSGETALHLTAKVGDVDLVRAVLASGTDLSVIDSDGNTAFDTAKQHHPDSNVLLDLLRVN